MPKLAAAAADTILHTEIMDAAVVVVVVAIVLRVVHRLAALVALRILGN
jgi:hypothetical protein